MAQILLNTVGRTDSHMISTRLNSKNSIIRVICLFSTLCFTFLLAGCGGGGGGGGESDSLPANMPPAVDAGQDQFTFDSNSVTLTGFANDSDGTIVADQWTQVAGTPVPVDGITTSPSFPSMA